MNLKFNKLFCIASIVLVSSCAVKTYTVSEKSAFTPTKYDISLDSLELIEQPKKEQDSLLILAERIIDSSEHKIAEYPDLYIGRDYLEINDSLIVEYFSYTPSNYERTIVFFIGNQSRQTSYVKYLQQLSVKTKSKIYAWNYRGYGNSNGKSSFKTQFDDNQKIFTVLECQEEDKELIVIGYSLGTVFASKLGVSNQSDKLILLAPVSDISDMLVHYKREFLSGFKLIFRPFINLRVKEDYVNSLSNIEEIEKFEGGLLILHAKDDSDLPYSMGKKLYEHSVSINKRFISVRKGGHGAPLEEDNWEKVILWINNGL